MRFRTGAGISPQCWRWRHVVVKLGWGSDGPGTHSLHRPSTQFTARHPGGWGWTPRPRAGPCRVDDGAALFANHWQGGSSPMTIVADCGVHAARRPTRCRDANTSKDGTERRPAAGHRPRPHAAGTLQGRWHEPARPIYGRGRSANSTPGCSGNRPLIHDRATRR